MMHLHCNVNVWEVKTAYLASVWVCVVPRVPVSLLAHSSVGPAPVASSGTMSSSAPRSERPTHPGRCTFPSESAATWLCVCVQSFTARCVKKKKVRWSVWSLRLGAGPAPEPCHSLTHHTHSLITEQQPAACPAVGVKKNDKLQHLETICPHSGAFVAQFCSPLSLSHYSFVSSWIFSCSYLNFSCLPSSLSFGLSLLICPARLLFSKAVWDSNMLILLLKWEEIRQRKNPPPSYKPQRGTWVLF